MNNDKNSKRMTAILRNSKFVSKRSAFFRIHGDGVLQIVKKEFEPGSQILLIRFGLYSMYGSLSERLFTNRGCITHYDAMKLVDPDYFRISLGYGDWVATHSMGKVSVFGSYNVEGVYSPEFWAAANRAMSEANRRADFETQLDYLQNVVLGKLDCIDTQEAICQMQSIYRKRDIGLDKVAPLLAANHKSEAIALLQSVLTQNRNAALLNGITEEALATDSCFLSNLSFEQFLLSSTDEDIQKYLRNNMKKNTEMFRTAFPHWRLEDLT